MPTLYASSVATGANNGTSWADAYTDLQAALNALQSGDHLHLDAPETKPWRGGYNLASRNGWTIDCNQGPSGATWLRGGILYSDWTAAGAVFSRTVAVAPRYVAYDFKRDNVKGAITGVDLTVERPAQWLAELGREAEDAVAWYGFLKPAATVTTSPADGEWSHTGGRLYVNPPGSPTLAEVAANCEPCVSSTNAILLNACEDFDFNGRGLTGILYPDYGSNAGYIVKANNCARGTIRGARGIAVGWHGFGFAAASRERCRLQDLLVVGQTISDGVGSVANPYVLAGDGAAGPADAHFTSLAAVMHAPALTNGRPLFNDQGRYDAVLLIAHTTTTGDYLPIRADRTLLLDFSHHQATRHGLTLPNSGGKMFSGSAAVGQPESLNGWGIVIADSKAWGRAAVPSPGVASDGCIFDRAGQGASDSPLIGLNGSLRMYLRRCLLFTGRHALGYFSSLDSNDLIVLDGCGIVIETDIGTHEPLAYANSSTAVLKLIETSVRSQTPNASVLLQTGNSSFSGAHLAVSSGGLNRIDASLPYAARANNLAFAFKDWNWWRASVAGASADRSAMTLPPGRLRGDWTRRHDMLNDDDVRQLAAAILANPDRRLALTAAGEVSTDEPSRLASRADVAGLASSAAVNALLAPIAAAGVAAADAQVAAESADAKLAAKLPSDDARIAGEGAIAKNLDQVGGGGGAGGLTSSQQAQLDTLLARTAAGVTVAYHGPVTQDSSTIELIQGDSYLDADNRGLTWTLKDHGLNLSGATATLTLHDLHSSHAFGVDAVIAPAGAAGEDATLTAELGDGQTNALQLGVERYGFDVQLTLADPPRPLTVVRGRCTVRDQYTRP